MNISFSPLDQKYFPYLLKWLSTPHVKKWWDSDVMWNKNLIFQKYNSYIGAKNNIHAFVINYDSVLIGYIQIYHKDNSIAGIDFYIGEEKFLNQGIGSIFLIKFMQEHIFHQFDYCFADISLHNEIAMKALKKAGFENIDEGMICSKNAINSDLLALG